MHVFNLIDGKFSPIQPSYRYVHRSHGKPGLSFTHPLSGPAAWRVVMPLGARDFYGELVPCPTHPTKGPNPICKWCGNPIAADGNCHGSVPALPSTDQEYHLLKLNNQKAAEQHISHILTLPTQPEAPSKLILWDDSGPLGDAVAYCLDGSASFLGYGHDMEETGIFIFPVVLVEGEATLISTADGTSHEYYFDAATTLSSTTAK